MATAPRITPKRESDPKGKFSCRSFKVFFLKYPICRLDWFAYCILTHVYVLHYINTLDKDFVVHFERKKKLTKFATFVAWYTMTQGKGQVWAQVAREPRAVLLSSRSPSLTSPAMVLVWLCTAWFSPLQSFPPPPPRPQWSPVVRLVASLPLRTHSSRGNCPMGSIKALNHISTIGMKEVLVNCLSNTIPPCWLIRAFIELTISDTTTSPQFIASLTLTAFLPSMGLPGRRTLTQSSTAPSRLQTIRYWRAQVKSLS